MTGAVVGAGLALLFAPQAGVEMRRLLREYLEHATAGLDKTIEQGTEMVDSAVERGQDFVEKGKQSLRETGHQAEASGEAGRKAFNEAKGELAAQHR
jgi:gas vesicle protein